VGCAVGAALGGGGTYLSQRLSGRKVLWDAVGASALTGCVSGLLLDGALTTATRPLTRIGKSAEQVGGRTARPPGFIVRPNGETVIVPRGAQGPFPVESGKGFIFRGGTGGNGLDDAVSGVRIMDPVLGGKYPKLNGYSPYLNRGGQAINPFSGQTVGKSSPWWHWEFR
jgi:hypothetical protein